MTRQIKRIRQAIEDSGLSHAELARRLVAAGFEKETSSHVSKIASGKIVPAITLGLAIAKELGVPAQYIQWGEPAGEEEKAQKANI